jgi:hypothetical protein
MIEVEDRLVLVTAHSFQDATERLAPAWKEYAEPYLNPNGYLVRWQLVEIKNVYSLPDDTLSPAGTEVYSQLRTVKLKSEYRWLPRLVKRLQRTRNRAAIAREHGNDLDAIVAAFQQEEATSEIPAVSFPPKHFVKRPLRSKSGKTRRSNKAPQPVSRTSKARGVSKREKRAARG